MSTLAELESQGVRKVRLSIWNPNAYVELVDEWPGAWLYDIGAGVGGGQPIPIGRSYCEGRDDWAAVPQEKPEGAE